MVMRTNITKIFIGFAAVMKMITTSIVTYAAYGNRSQHISVMNTAAPERAMYISKDGWRTQYEKKLFEVNETRDGAYFVYTGDCAGTCYVGFNVIDGKSPTEVLGKKTENWNPDDTIRSEGFFYGDNWSYIRRLNPAEGKVPVYEMYEAAEYNGKVFLVEIYQTMGNNDRMNSQISYNLSMVYDTLDFDHYDPQTEFSNYLGTYQHVYDEAVDGQVQLVTDTITLNPDHTGKMEMQDEVDFYWGSSQFFMDSTWNNRREFTIEGDSIYVNMDDNNWVEFIRVEEEDLE